MMKTNRILVPVDFSAGSRAALQWAVSAAERLGGSIEVLHAWRASADSEPILPTAVYETVEHNAKSQMAVFMDSVVVPSTVDVITRVQFSNAVALITHLSSDFDMIVMGTHGRTGLRRLLLGSVAEQVVRLSSCPVVTVRTPAEPVGDDASAAKAQVVHVMFEDRAAVEEALDALEALGVSVDQVSLVMSEDAHDRDFKALEKTKVWRGATAGSLIGGSLGGILGGLASVSAIATGGIGMVVMGPAIALAAAGGLFGGLLGHNAPADQAAILKAHLTEGRMLMAIHLDSSALLVPVAELVTRLNGERLAI